MELDTKSLRLLVLSAAKFCNGFTDELFEYENADHQTICDHETELTVLIANVNRLSVLTLSMIEALEVSDNSDEIIDDIHNTATTNLNFSEQMLGILTFAKR
jgi:hypothetical protein